MSHQKVPVITAAYAIVSSKDDDYNTTLISADQSAVAVPTATAAPVQELNRPMAQSYSVRPEFAHIPETKGLVWYDDFFENENDEDNSIVAVFDLDYEQLEAYYSKTSWLCYGAMMFFPTLLSLSLLALVPCYLSKNVQWDVRSRHVAITRDGIRVVQGKRPTCWGSPCSDAGKRSRTIPFDKITDCDIVEAAGNTCICIVNTLDVVHVDTASRQTDSQHELTISGLTNAVGFKKLVWAMKREYHPAVARMPQSTVVEMMDRAGLKEGLDNTMSQEDIAMLLREIRDELRRNNEVHDKTKADA